MRLCQEVLYTSAAPVVGVRTAVIPPVPQVHSNRAQMSCICTGIEEVVVIWGCVCVSDEERGDS